MLTDYHFMKLKSIIIIFPISDGGHYDKYHYSLRALGIADLFILSVFEIKCKMRCMINISAVFKVKKSSVGLH